MKILAMPKGTEGGSLTWGWEPRFQALKPSCLGGQDGVVGETHLTAKAI